MNLARTSITAIQEAQASVVGSDYSEDEILADIMQLRYSVLPPAQFLDAEGL